MGTRWAPGSSYNWVEITPITRMKEEQLAASHLFPAIYRGPITPFIAIIGGPPCNPQNPKAPIHLFVENFNWSKRA